MPAKVIEKKEIYTKVGGSKSQDDKAETVNAYQKIMDVKGNYSVTYTDEWITMHISIMKNKPRWYNENDSETRPQDDGIIIKLKNGKVYFKHCKVAVEREES